MCACAFKRKPEGVFESEIRKNREMNRQMTEGKLGNCILCSVVCVVYGAWVWDRKDITESFNDLGFGAKSTDF